MKSLKTVLNKLYSDYDFKTRVLHDPIEFPHRYKNPKDIEAVGFISCCFAYGKVELFKTVLEKMFRVMGESPHDFLLNFNLKKQKKLFEGLQYRFNRNDDVLCLLHVLGKVLKKYGSLHELFMGRFSGDDATIGAGLSGMIAELLNVDTSSVYGEDIRTDGFLQFFPSPERGSACKRMCLYLRWMVRDRDIDFGVWKGIPPDRLVIPLDVHIARISKCLHLTKRSSQDWKMAVEITNSLKRFDPEDPLKYDFALCHQGISKVCDKAHCADCTLFGPGFQRGG